MADDTLRLKVKADTGELKNLKTEMNSTLMPRSADKMRDSMRTLEVTVRDLTREKKRLNEELSRVNQGSDAYKKLGDELDIVQRKSRAVTAELRDVNKNAMGVRSFLAGMAGGVGLAPFVPADSGMFARMTGAAVGQVAARGGRAAAAPFVMPGLGGLSTALGAIPVAGPAAAGALQTAQGLFQQAVGYEQAQLQNLFLGGSRFAGISPVGRGRMSRTTQLALQSKEEEAKRQILALQEARSAKGWQQAWNDTQAATRQHALEQARADKRAGRQTGGASAIDAMNMENTVGTIQRLTPGSVGGFGRAAGIRTRPDMQQLAKNLYHARIEQAKALITSEMEQLNELKAQARSEMGRNRFLRMRQRYVGTTLGVGFGTEFGFQPTQVQGMLGQFARARGGRLDQEMRMQFREAMAAQVWAGIGSQQAGQFARMNVAGGGGAGGRTLAEQIAYSMTQGLEGSQIAESLSTLVSLGQAAEQQGVKLDPREFQRSAAILGVSGAGLQGLQAQRVAGGLTRAGMQLSQRGISGPQDMLMLRAAGYNPAEGPMSYISAMERLEGGLDANTLNNLLGMMTEGTRGQGVFANPRMQAFLMRRQLGRMGVGVSAGQATRIINEYQRTGSLSSEAWSRIKAERKEAESSEGQMDLITAAKVRARVGAPEAVRAAGLAATQITEGQKWGKMMNDLQKISLTTVETLGNFRGGLQSSVDVINEFANAINDFTQGNVLKKAFDFLPDVLVGGGGGK